MIRALILREWWLQRRRLASIAVVCLAGNLLLPLDAAWALVLIGTVPVAAIGLRMGGEERVRGCLELLLGRVPSACWLMRVRGLLGLVVVLGLVALFLAADAANLYRLFWSSLTEFGPEDLPVPGLAFSVAVSFELFVYALAVFLGSTATTRRALALRWPLLLTVTWLTTVWLVQTSAVALGRREAVRLLFERDGRVILVVGYGLLATVLFTLSWWRKGRLP